jgi:regulator of replication initiation timing
MNKERDDEFIRHDCKDRIAKLEALLEKSSQEKDEMRKQILDLVSEVASLRTEIKYLTDKRAGSI